MARVPRPSVSSRNFDSIKYRLRSTRASVIAKQQENDVTPETELELDSEPTTPRETVATVEIIEISDDEEEQDGEEDQHDANDVQEISEEVFEQTKPQRRPVRRISTEKREDVDNEVDEPTATISTPAQNLRPRKTATVSNPAEMVTVPRSTKVVTAQKPAMRIKVATAQSKALKAHKRTKANLHPIAQKQPKLDKVRRKILFEKHVGTNRAFAGFISFDSGAAYVADVERMQDVEVLYNSGQALAYWTDGSCGKNGLSAAVVWVEQKGWLTRGFKINSGTGGSWDAELYALAAAMSIAVDKVKQQSDVKLVRIFTDAKSLLQSLANRSSSSVGPTISGKYALVMLHEQADWLKECDVRVELTWVKGHHNSAGNQLADQTAKQARILQQSFSSDQYKGLVIDMDSTAQINEEVDGSIELVDVTHGPTIRLEHSPRNEAMHSAPLLQQGSPDNVETIDTQSIMVGPEERIDMRQKEIEELYRQLAEIEERKNAILSAITDKERRQAQDRQRVATSQTDDSNQTDGEVTLVEENDFDQDVMTDKGDGPTASDTVSAKADRLIDDSFDSYFARPFVDNDQEGRILHHSLESKILALRLSMTSRSKSIVVLRQKSTRLSERRLGLREQQVARLEARQTVAEEKLKILERKQSRLTLEVLTIRTKPTTELESQQEIVGKESKSCGLEAIAGTVQMTV
jgi:ribonuclease HI